MSSIQQQIARSRLQKIFNLSLVLFLAVLSLMSLDLIRNKVRDIKRKADLKQIQTALELYRAKTGYFPLVADKDFQGWDTSYEPPGQEFEFLSVLEKEKTIDRAVKDPINSYIYYYRYKKFPAGSFGCKDAFYVLQIMNFESNIKDHGWGKCPKRNFVDEAPNGYTVQVFE